MTRRPHLLILCTLGGLALSSGRAAGAPGVPATPGSGGRPTQVERVQQRQGVGLPVLPGFAPTARAEQARPTLDALVTIRLLPALLAGPGDLRPSAAVRAALLETLRPLQAQQTLQPQELARRLETVLGALSAPQRQFLSSRRAALEAQVQRLLSRARRPPPLHPADVALRDQGFLVPGGQAVVRRVYDDPTWNPYAESEPNAVVLNTLLAMLGEPGR